MEKITVAIIGGSGALGQSVTQAFLDRGANVAVAYHSEEGWQAARERFMPGEGALLGVQTDVTDEESVQAFFRKLGDEYGGLDALIYLAGYFFIGPMTWQTDVSVFRKLVDVNLVGAFTACKYAIPYLLEKKRGNIVFMPAKSVLYGTPHFGPYSVSKAGLLTLMESLTAELRETEIAVNCVMPDAIITPKTMASPHPEPDKWVSTEQVAETILAQCYSEGNILRGSVLKCFGK